MAVNGKRLKSFKRARIPFIGQGSIGRSEIINSERLVNLFPRVDPTGKAVVALYNCPGLLSRGTLGPGPTRAGLEYDDVAYIVSGDRFYSVDTNYIATLRGTINSNSGFVSIQTNGLVVVFVDGAKGWSYTIASGVFAQITDVDFPTNPIVVDVLDNTFIVVEGGSQRFFTSVDGTTWVAADFASAETVADDLIGGIVDHQELVLLGKKSVEIWYNSGGTFTFSRRSTLENGCAATASVSKLDNSVFWLDNKYIVRRLNGYNDVRVSTHAQEYRIKRHTAAERAAATAFTSSTEGHSFYQLTVGDETFCYDVAANKWHERRYTIPASGVLTRHRAQWCIEFNGINLVGDYENGNIYEYDLDTYTDNGEEISAIGTYRHIDAEGRRIWYHLFELELESGIGIQSGQGSDPKVELRWSNDGGREWSFWRQADIGKIGKYKTRAKWQTLDSSDDRVFEFRITDPVRRVIANANIEVTPGSM